MNRFNGMNRSAAAMLLGILTGFAGQRMIAVNVQPILREPFLLTRMETAESAAELDRSRNVITPLIVADPTSLIFPPDTLHDAVISSRKHKASSPDAPAAGGKLAASDVLDDSGPKITALKATNPLDFIVAPGKKGHKLDAPSSVIHE